MPIFHSPPFEADISRNSILVDTNVLYAAFGKKDRRKGDAKAFLDDWDGDLLIPVSVVVETWGMLVGSDRDWAGGFEFLIWLKNPGNRALLLPQHISSADFMFKTTADERIDCVDAFLMSYADDVTKHCNFKPFISIATYDFSDYYKCLIKYNLNFTLINPETLEEYQ
jgi:predicted nucleic acid-binding protein